MIFQLIFGNKANKDSISLSFWKISLISLFGQVLSTIWNFFLVNELVSLSASRNGWPVIGILTIELIVGLFLILMILIQRYIQKRTLTLTFFFILTTSVFGQVNEEELVRKSFDGYRTSLMNNNEEDVIKYVDSRTIKYYSDILDLVKNADSTKVETLSLLDKLTVLTIRHRVLKEDILSFDGKTLLTYAIKNGMIDKSSVSNISIGKVTIDFNFAKGQFILNGQESPYILNFYKEGQWKFDLTSTFPITIPVFQKWANELGGPNKFIFASLKLLTGKTPGPDIWHPVR